MTAQPVVVFSDIRLDGDLPRYLSEVLLRTNILAPDRSTPEVIEQARADAVVWVSRFQPVGPSDLDRMPNLKLLSAWGVGYDHINVAAATARCIPVCINPTFSRSVAEAALTLILALSKRMHYLMRSAQTGQRVLESERGIEIRGKTLGIVGFGRIGQEVGDLGQRLEMRVLAYDPYRLPGDFPDWAHPVPLDVILRESDFVVTVAALTPETRHLIGAPQLALMKPSAYLINVGRGALVDERALFTALQQRQIAGAGLDVWEEEPPRPDNPLLMLDNVIGTPHKLASTWDSLRQICESIQSNTLRVIAGLRPEHVVNPEVFARIP
ncbi:MAG: hypothetical protein IT324_29850 [Anaerolineae bacterium]|nr:hypothetical protein [Anaerolineae bacterium]